MNLLLDSVWQIALNQKRKKRSVQHYLLQYMRSFNNGLKYGKKSILPHSLNSIFFYTTLREFTQLPQIQKSMSVEFFSLDMGLRTSNSKTFPETLI